MKADPAGGLTSQPYVGLRAFRMDESGLFFGRAKESLDIARLWRANKLTVLYGSSGVGKTSLLQAGVIPTLDSNRFDIWPVGRIRPGLATPITMVPDNLYTFALLSSWTSQEQASTLSHMTILGFLRKQAERNDRYGDPMPILVAIDQFEELFSAAPQRQGLLRPFIAELADALQKHQELRLLISLREDYLAAVLPYEHILAGQSRTRARLLPFDQTAALEAIQKPLIGTGRAFEPGAAEDLVADLRTIKFTNALGEESAVTVDSIEPVQVQVVCSALWNSLPPNTPVITSAHVREHVDVDRFLANFCGRALGAVAREHDIAAARIRSWLQQTFITELGTRGTAYEGIGQTAGMPNAVVSALEDVHILKAELRSGSRWYELQHDRLIEPLRQGDPEEHLEAARLARADGDWDLVERHSVQAIRVFGDDDLRVRASAEQMLGEVAQARHKADEAVAHYHTAASLFEVIQDSDAVGELLAAAGRLSLARGRHSAAVTDMRAAIARIPGDLEVQTDLALAIWHTGQPRVAVAVLNNVLALDGNLTTALRIRGEILADLEEVEAALRDLDRVRRDQDPSTLAARALALALSGRLEAAEQEAADALANGPEDGPVLLRTARVRMLAGDREGAARLVAMALAATRPGLPPHLTDSAQRLLDEQRRDQPGHHQV
jgi:tetratricopeptide (TPR) repeat protein